jgi:hypothetical protein
VSRWDIWKHECDPEYCPDPCPDPWQVDTPVGWCYKDIQTRNTFATQQEALAFAMDPATRELICPLWDRPIWHPVETEVK